MSKKEKLQNHLERHLGLLSDFNSGNIPEKHKHAPQIYKQYLEREIFLTKRTLDLLSK